MFLFRFIIRFEIERDCLLCVTTYQIIGAIFSNHFIEELTTLLSRPIFTNQFKLYICVLGPCTFADRPPKVFPDRHVSCLAVHFHSLRSLSIIHVRPLSSLWVVQFHPPGSPSLPKIGPFRPFFTWYHIIDVLKKNSNQIVSSMQV